MSYRTLAYLVMRNPGKEYTERQLLYYSRAPSVTRFHAWRKNLFRMYGIRLRKIRGKPRYNVIEYPMVCLVKIYFFKFGRIDEAGVYSGATFEIEFKMSLRRSEITRQFMEDMKAEYIASVPEYVEDYDRGINFNIGIQVTDKVAGENEMTDEVICRVYDINKNRMKVWRKPNILYDTSYTAMDETRINPFYLVSIDIDDYEAQQPQRYVFGARRFISVFRRRDVRVDSRNRVRQIKSAREHVILVVDKGTLENLRSQGIANLVTNPRARIQSREQMNDDPMRVTLDKHRYRRDSFFDYSKGVLFDYKIAQDMFKMKDPVWTRMR